MKFTTPLLWKFLPHVWLDPPPPKTLFTSPQRGPAVTCMMITIKSIRISYNLRTLLIWRKSWYRLRSLLVYTSKSRRCTKASTHWCRSARGSSPSSHTTHIWKKTNCWTTLLFPNLCVPSHWSSATTTQSKCDWRATTSAWPSCRWSSARGTIVDNRSEIKALKMSFCNIRN